MRRALRVWPLYYSVVALTFGIGPTLLRHYGLDVSQATNGSLLQYLFFVQNLWNSSKSMSTTLGVTWSLAIEEQFYLIWPALVFTLSDKALKRVLGAVLIILPLMRIVALHRGIPGIVLYTNTLFRLDGIAIGCVLATLIHSRQFTRNQLKWSSVAALVIGGTVACALIPAYVSQPAHPFAFSALAIAFVGFVGLALSSSVQTGLFGRALASRSLGYLGTISYCVYLIHVPIFLLVGRGLRHFLGGQHQILTGDFLFLIMAFGTTCGIAAASWHLFERPILQLKSKFAPSTHGSRAAAAFYASGAASPKWPTEAA